MPKRIMVVLPVGRDRNYLGRVEEKTDEYEIVWMDDDLFQYPFPEEGFSLVDYTEKCSDFIAKSQVDGLYYSHDLANLVAAELAERHDIYGPSLEAMFLTNHKYYSRKNQPNSPWVDYIDLDTGEWGENKPTYPCYIKPTSLTMTLHQHQVKSQEEMDRLLNEIRDDLTEKMSIYHEFFREYIDLDKYPLADKNIMVVEELIEDFEQHCVEGWIGEDGEINVWAVSDHIYYPGDRKSIDCYATPTCLTEEVHQEIVEYAKEAVRQHGIDAGFWNVEVWRVDDGSWDDNITATEVNGRAASVWYNLYYNTFDVNMAEAILHLCGGNEEKTAELAPDYYETERCGSQFHVITYGEGEAEEFLDHDYIDSVEEPEIEVFYPRGSTVKQKETTGVWLARFELFGDDMVELCEKADELRSNMLKKPEYSPTHPERKPFYEELRV